MTFRSWEHRKKLYHPVLLCFWCLFWQSTRYNWRKLHTSEHQLHSPLNYGLKKSISSLPLGSHVTDCLVSKLLFLNLSYFLSYREKMLLSLPTTPVMVFFMYSVGFSFLFFKVTVSSFLLMCSKIVYPKEKCKDISTFYVLWNNQHLQGFLIQETA